MKKILFVLVIVIMIIGLVACANARENAVENIIENMIEKESGEKIDIDIDADGDGMTMKTEEGEITVQDDDSGLAWPGDKLPAGFPVFGGAKVTTVIDADGGVLIGLAGVTQNDADNFIGNFTTGDWETSTIESAGTNIFSADNDDEFMSFSWNSEEGNGTITFGTK
ncbi:MAG: hypothetical protein HN389_09820 [Clostridia bacterium]|jgi:hypothetical protein|nr:hypothetical protein [Clostridia bacterium]